MVKVAVNGFGRIGRAFMRLAAADKNIEVVAINDLGDAENLAYLLTYDTVYGKAPFDVALGEGGSLIINGKAIPVLAEPDPAKLPWKAMGVEVVIEATGVFETFAKAKAHLTAGAKRVIISAPAKDDAAAAGVTGGTVLMGLDDQKLKTCDISSNASCTTNAASPMITILDEGLGIEKALLNTVHAYTATQAIVDGPAKKDFRRGRAAAQNISPSTTGAAIAVTKAYPALEGKFDGLAVRVPVPVGSLIDITFIAKRDTSVEEVNGLLKKAASDKRWEGIYTATDEQIVSSDIIGNTHASIADLSFTKVVGGNLVKVFAWYDNEMGYAETLRLHVHRIGEYL